MRLLSPLVAAFRLPALAAVTAASLRVLAAVAAALLPVPAVAAAAGSEPSASARQESEDEVALLVAHGVAFARNALREQGGFAPYAFVMRDDGSVQRISAPGGRAMSPEDLLDALGAAFRSRAAAGAYRAVAIFADVVIAAPDGEQKEAVHAGAEHRDGYCRNVYTPYRRTPGGDLVFESALVTAREGRIFARCD